MTAAPEQPASSPTEQQALDWFTRLRDPDLSPGEQAAFDHWYQQPQNAHAYQAVEALWQALELPARRVHKATRSKRRWPGYAAAACLCLVAGASWLALPTLQDIGSDYTTAAGQRREVKLADGSLLRLDSATAIDVKIDAGERTVHLRHGRLFADVVHDGRPFVVEVGQARVRVLGTRFYVGRTANAEEVVLLSGRVDVSSAGQHQSLAPGQRLSIQGERLEPVQLVDAERMLAWRDGQLRVRDVPLREVLEQLSAYQGKRLVLLDQAAGQRLVSGSFNLDQAASALDALATSQHLQLSSVFGRLLIIR
jgi:ferric-dicitrate binding protein FerR (iron transport regulator)